MVYRKDGKVGYLASGIGEIVGLFVCLFAKVMRVLWTLPVWMLWVHWCGGWCEGRCNLITWQTAEVVDTSKLR